jgi:chondroitin AC lyase
MNNVKTTIHQKWKGNSIKYFVVTVVLFAFAFSAFKVNDAEKEFIKDNFELADQKLKSMVAEIKGSGNVFPRTTAGDKLSTTDQYEWTSGFFAGTLWYAYEYTKDESLQEAADAWTEKMRDMQHYTGNHDLGFMMYCSYGNAYRLEGGEENKEVLIQSAKSLSSRFNPSVGVIKSWNRFNSWHGNKTYQYPVIIDNMMNLELLFYASKATGDDSYRKLAITHAVNTMKHQIRPDYSSYHVVCYDSVGNVVGRETAQGYADNSTWSRGQAWGIYGFTMCYRETRDKRFLKTAQGMADFFIDHKNLPEDKIPYWDFNANEKGYTPGVKSNANNITTKYRDASAAAITASALLELSTYSSGKKAKRYKAIARQMLYSLASPAYKAPMGANGNFLLTQSVGSIPHNNEINVPLVYADYYFLEALLRYERTLNGEDLFAAKKQ